MYIACSTNEETNSDDNFDRTTMLTHWADNIIIPSYNNYQTKLQVLSTETNVFVATPTETNLKKVREAWLEAYKAYQYVSMFKFGKAEEINFREKNNTFPTDVAGIKSNIDLGTYNLSLISQFTKQGFPALDYILNGLGTDDSAILSFYTKDVKAANYKKYLSDIVSTLITTNNTVITDWNSGFRASYIANNGKTVTSSINKTINSFIENFEKNVRTNKLGIPAGLFSGNIKYPEKVEAFYHNNSSKTLLNAAIQASQNFFNGKSFSSTATGPSLNSYLEALAVKKNDQNLSTIINNQFALAFENTKNLNESFATQVTNDNDKMITTFDVLQQNVVYLKLDMMQGLKITVDYVDSDGD